MIKYGHLPEQFGLTLISDMVVRKEALLNNDCFDCLEGIINHYMRHPDPTVVPIYNFEILHRVPGPYQITKYRYDMKRLGMLTDGERSTIATATRQYYMPSNSIEFPKHQRDAYPELIEFIREVCRLGRYRDFHYGNVMKDDDESYKLIDLEGFIYTPFNRQENDWIRE